MRHGRGVDGVVDVARTAATIAGLGADLVALQELDRGVERSGGEDQPARLEELTGLGVRFFPTLALQGGHFGIALAVRSELDVSAKTLPHGPASRPHGMIVGRWSGSYVVATHLSRDDAAWHVEMDALVQSVTSLEGPVIVMGDLNRSPEGLEALVAAGLAYAPGVTPTVPSWSPRWQLDHVLAGRGARVVRSWTVQSDASDHLPLVADVEVTSAR